MKIDLSQHSCNLGLCSININFPILVAKKKKRKYILTNDTKEILNKYDLDDCVFKTLNIQNFRLCDYLIIFNETYSWVELKGSDLNGACEQIYNSYKNAVLYGQNKKHFARVVVSKVNENETRGDYFKKIKTLFKNNFDYSSGEYNKDKTSLMHQKS